VLKPEESTEESTQKVPLVHIQRRYGIYRTYARQIAEYLKIRARLRDHPPIIEQVFGIVDTDHGLGLIVERINGRDGGLAPTLFAVVEANGYSQELEDRILRLRDETIRHEIITGDLHGGNIVCGHDAEHGERLVMVESIGDKTFIPVNTLSRYINRRSNERHFRHVINGLKRLDASKKAGSSVA
ncbi:MAG TPA: YrbL family protein, partial [Candidatus Limnocylindria bacterium]|nr:YrbL family protein [Candidatus Limnocylindria bacterium]